MNKTFIVRVRRECIMDIEVIVKNVEQFKEGDCYTVKDEARNLAFEDCRERLTQTMRLQKNEETI